MLYAVPGSPLVLERSVRHLLDRDDVEVTVLPAMSFLDVVWARLGIDPIEAGVRLVDGHEFATAAAGERGPLLVAHAHADWVLSEIKLAVEGASGDEPVTILQALGTPQERIVETTWSELDRTITADHLTSLWIPHLATPVGAEYVRFHQLTRLLREQCPWDIEQTHDSLIPHLLEEAYEVVDAIQDSMRTTRAPTRTSSRNSATCCTRSSSMRPSPNRRVASRSPTSPPASTTNSCADTPTCSANSPVTISGRPRCSPTGTTSSASEKSRTSVFDGIPRSMPALAYAAKVGAKASKVGFDWPDVTGAFPKIAEETAELFETLDATNRLTGTEETAGELGDLLFAIVNVARHLRIDPELALRAATDKFRTRFEGVERLARERSIDLKSADLTTLDALWDDVKARSRR